MANQVYLDILRQGVEVWNQWREDKQVIRPDLRKANLERANLKGVNLKRANLEGAILWNACLERANLVRANLIGADLVGVKLNSADLRGAWLGKVNLEEAWLGKANLEGADLGNADFSGANLEKAYLKGADLERANLREVNLRGADLERANLKEANLEEASLEEVHLERADLTGADLRGANLWRADLRGADLTGADLRGAYLWEADLREADLTGADFWKANLWKANLFKIQALSTNFNGAILTGACLEDWQLNSETNLEGVISDYIYLNPGQQQRHPPTGVFASGEFTSLVKRVAEPLDLLFKDGIDWKAFLKSLCKLQEKHKLNVERDDQKLPLVQRIENREDGTFVIRVSVLPGTNKSEYEKEFETLYQQELKRIEENYRVQLNLKEEQIGSYRKHNASLERIINILASRPINKWGEL